MQLKLLRNTVIALLVIGFAVAARWTVQAFEVSTAYTAKQVCSGVFVAGLPAEFVFDNDVRLAQGALGPLFDALTVEIDRDEGVVQASLLGVRSRADFIGAEGCVLNAQADVPSARESSASARGAAAVDVTVAKLPSLNSVLPALNPVLDAAFTEPQQGQRRTLAVLVSQNGRLLAERYARPATAHTPLQSWSMNKSLMATWIGMQVERGVLSVAMPIAPALASVDADLASSVAESLTLGHLLHMESGLGFEEVYGPGTDAVNMLFRSDAAWRVAASNGQAHPPGENFSYSSGDTNLASWVWQQSLERPYIAWIEEEFAKPLGLRKVVAEHDASGTQVGSSYTYMTARDWLKLGEFWLAALRGQSELLSATWMRSAVTPRESATRGNYGRGFWLNTQGADYPSLPRDMFYASGHNGQYVIVLPSQNAVIVRLGLASDSAASGFAELVRGVSAALPPL